MRAVVYRPKCLFGWLVFKFGLDTQLRAETQYRHKDPAISKKIGENMQNVGYASIDEFLDDYIVYRNLVPIDKRLPSLDALRQAVGLPPGQIPRKSEPNYARVIVHLLQHARALEVPETTIKRLLFIGDTRLNDGTAFVNICQAGNWPGFAFIGSETEGEAGVEVTPVANACSLYLANKWAAVADFNRFCAEQNFPIDEATAIVVDLDKTALGARGRNSHVIDQARVQAVYKTVANLLGDAFDEVAFQTAYDQLNQVEFHPFTSDNQDYLAYICLILGSGLYSLESITGAVQNGQLESIAQFMEQVNSQVGALSPELADIHRDIYARAKVGDPTPFKVFRRNEYHTTIERMGQQSDDASIETLLATEIVITQEVRALALEWKSRGALLFGLSDKPDEASIPTAELAKKGFLPIHQTKTHAVGA
jgi:hypothetical protein